MPIGMCWSDRLKILITSILLFMVAGSMAQCPENIGFENGNFQNWVILEGSVVPTSGAIINNVVGSSVRVNLKKNNYPQELDAIGLFPVNSPNGSDYAVKLGDTAAMGRSQTVSYTFTIPADQDNYSIIYNYAVVLQDPGHESWAQPSFSSKVFDVTSNKYIECGAFNFVASSKLPGFIQSARRPGVFYKPWSPMTIKLVGYAGKTVRLEFTSHDCAYGPHFGYAYVDINENCSSPISGNAYCSNANSMSLTAPDGFNSYQWYNDDYSKILGSSNVLKFATIPPTGTNYHLIITPYPDLGCLDTLHTTVKMSAQEIKLQTVDTIVSCNNSLVDLTANFVTSGSTPGLSFSYFSNLSLTDHLPTPKQVFGAGTYYIKAMTSDGCIDSKPVTVVNKPYANFILNNPAAVCFPNKIDLTNAAITAGSDAGLNFSYWIDSAASIHLTNPQLMDTSGLYYIKANSSKTCTVVKPVNVAILKNPVITIFDQTTCGSVNITAPNGFRTSESGITPTYWKDSMATINLPTPDSIKLSGTYYIKASNTIGCSTIAAIQANVLPTPNLVVNHPATVCAPDKIDLTNAAITAGSSTGLQYTYWANADTTIVLSNPQLIDSTAIYFIQATNASGCSIVKSVNATVAKPPTLIINNPADCGFVNLYSVNVFASNQSDTKTSFWQDQFASINLINPDSILLSGTYYIKATNSSGCSSIATVAATVFPIPYFTIAQAPMVNYPTTIDLTALVKPTMNSSFTYWQNLAATNAVLNPTRVSYGGMYYIKSTSSNGCMVVDSVELSIKLPTIVPPNVFSPNNDGINDTWDIPMLHYFPNCTVEVYSRYGQLVFNSKGYNKNWDGTFNNQVLPIGAYYYIIKNSPGENPISGSVLIIR